MLLTPDLTNKSSGLKSNETCTFKIKKDKEANLFAFFLWILAMFGFPKWVFKAGGKGVVPGLSNIWPLRCTEFAGSQQGSKLLELTDIKQYVYNYFPCN